MSIRVSARRLFGIYSKDLPRRRDGSHVTKAEERFQVQCVDFLRLAAYPDVMWHHSPNEGERHVVGHEIQKAMGRQAGFPDLVIWRAAHLGLPLYFVELKAPGKPDKPTDEQREFLKHAAEMGHRIAVINSFDKFVQQTIAWGLCPDD